jgi:hypothetical protein
MLLKVETKNLVSSCPSWEDDYRRMVANPQRVCANLIYGRIFEIRRRWSYKTLWVYPPSAHPSGSDLHSLLHQGGEVMCGSHSFWLVAGPPTILQEMGGDPNDKRVWLRPVQMYLCQHEIQGD